MAPQRSHERGDAGSAAPAVLLLDPAARVVAASSSAARLVDRSSESLRGLAVSDMFGGDTEAVHGWLERLTELREPPPPLVLDLTFVRNDGTRLAFDGVLYAIRTGPAERGEVVAGLKVRPNSGLVVKSELLTAQRRLIERVAARDDLVGSLRDVALFAERDYIVADDIKRLVSPVFGHRLVINEKYSQRYAQRYAGSSGGRRDVDQVLQEILDKVEVPL